MKLFEFEAQFLVWWMLLVLVYKPFVFPPIKDVLFIVVSAILMYIFSQTFTLIIKTAIQFQCLKSKDHIWTILFKFKCVYQITETFVRSLNNLMICQ